MNDDSVFVILKFIEQQLVEKQVTQLTESKDYRLSL